MAPCWAKLGSPGSFTPREGCEYHACGWLLPMMPVCGSVSGCVLHPLPSVCDEGAGTLIEPLSEHPHQGRSSHIVPVLSSCRKGELAFKTGTQQEMWILPMGAEATRQVDEHLMTGAGPAKPHKRRLSSLAHPWPFEAGLGMVV